MLDESGLIDESGLTVGTPVNDPQTGITRYEVSGYDTVVPLAIIPEELPDGQTGYQVAVGPFEPVIDPPLTPFNLAYAAGLQLCKFGLVVKRSHQLMGVESSF